MQLSQIINININIVVVFKKKNINIVVTFFWWLSKPNLLLSVPQAKPLLQQSSLLLSSLSLSQARNKPNQKTEKTKKPNMSSPSKRREMDLMKLLFLNFSISLYFHSCSYLFSIGYLNWWFSYCLGWWVITKWRWLTMECKSFMFIFMDQMKVN